MRSTTLRVIAGLEMGSGAYCVVAGGGLLAANPLQGWLYLLLCAIGAASVVAGYWLWRGEARGVRLSLMMQILQTLQAAIPGVVFVLVIEPALFIGFPSGEPFAFRAMVGSEAQFAFWHHTAPFRLEANLIALACAVVLYRARTPRALQPADPIAAKSPA